MDWIMENKSQIWLVVTTVVTLASLIAKLTPTTWDDKIVGKILKIVSINK